jgi:hypothetical protein
MTITWRLSNVQMKTILIIRVLMLIFSTNINKINNYLSPQIIEHKKNKNANRPSLGQTQKCRGVKQIQVISAPNIVIDTTRTKTHDLPHSRQVFVLFNTCTWNICHWTISNNQSIIHHYNKIVLLMN